MLWVKLWADMLGDPKLIRAERLGAKELLLLPWLLLWAARGDDDGRLTLSGVPLDPIDLARDIPGATAKRVERAICELTEIGVLTRDHDGAMRFVKWKERAGSKPSETREAWKERQQTHRLRKKEAAGIDVTLRHAGQGVTTASSVTPQKQSQSEEEEQAEHTQALKATSRLGITSRDDAALPPAAAALLRSVPADKRALVESEMRAVLVSGHPFRKTTVRADRERLESKCKETLDAHEKDPKRDLWAYALTKLADRADVAARHVATERAAVHDDEREFAARRGRAMAWAEEHKSDAERLRADLVREFPGGPIFDMMRESVFVTRACQFAEGR